MEGRVNDNKGFVFGPSNELVDIDLSTLFARMFEFSQAISSRYRSKSGCREGTKLRNRLRDGISIEGLANSPFSSRYQRLRPADETTESCRMRRSKWKCVLL